MKKQRIQSSITLLLTIHLLKMKVIAFLTFFGILIVFVKSHPGYIKLSDENSKVNLHGIEDVSRELGENEPVVRGVRAVCDDAFCAKMCRLDRKRGGRCWGSVCVCDRP
ncbi:uncharacterized protein isoform X1 [Leptinotarsa decemlineata]|uniref:uncharacterized protein isoform X1 n=1 Tax=Leptinotarsa decemlineata TaxID=7539 RepID=UPI003D30C816